MKKVLLFITITILLISFVSCKKKDNKKIAKEKSENIVNITEKEQEDNNDKTTKEEVKEYLVSFYNYDGTLLYSVKVKENESVTFNGSSPTKPSNEEYNYEFDGWDKDLKNIQSDLEVHAVFKELAITFYNVSFYNYDGTLICSIKVKEKEEAVYNLDNPTKPSDEEFDYEFIGWDKDLSCIMSDLDVVAQFEAKAKVNWGDINWF